MSLNWFVRRVLVPVVAWAMPRVPDLAQLRDAFDLAYKHRNEDWRRHVWSLAADRAERRRASDPV